MCKSAQELCFVGLLMLWNAAAGAQPGVVTVGASGCDADSLERALALVEGMSSAELRVAGTLRVSTIEHLPDTLVIHGGYATCKDARLGVRSADTVRRAGLVFDASSGIHGLRVDGGDGVVKTVMLQNLSLTSPGAVHVTGNVDLTVEDVDFHRTDGAVAPSLVLARPAGTSRLTILGHSNATLHFADASEG